MSRGPELRTLLLVLCPVAADDAAALHAHWSHPDVRRYLWDDAVTSSPPIRAASRGQRHGRCSRQRSRA